MGALVIAIKDIKLRIRDRSFFIQGFIAPLALATIINFAFAGGGNSFHPKYIVVDLDHGPLAAGFVDQVLKGPALKDFMTLSTKSTEAAARPALDVGAASAAFVIPKGFSQSILTGQVANLKVLRSASSQIGADVAIAISNAFVTQVNANRLSVATALPDPNSATPEQVGALVPLLQNIRVPIELRQGKVGTREVKPAAYFGPSMAIFFLFFTVQFGARSLIAEKREGTLARLAASPTSTTSILLGKLLSVFVVGLTSLGALLVAVTLIFGANLGDHLAVAAIAVAIVIAAVGVTAMVISFTKSAEQADAFGAMATMALTLLGGNFIPLNQAPALFRKLSLLTPNGWALRSFTDLIADGGGVRTILPAVGVILAFGVVGLTVAALRSRKLVVA